MCNADLIGLEDISHPVHFVQKSGRLSPSALIPFCEFGGDMSMSSIGVKIYQMDVPVCNSFQAKILNDQLCYEVDLNKFSNKSNIEKELNSGFAFFMDYNEDRQSIDTEAGWQKKQNKTNERGIVEKIANHGHLNEASIYLNSIGKC